MIGANGEVLLPIESSVFVDARTRGTADPSPQGKMTRNPAEVQEIGGPTMKNVVDFVPVVSRRFEKISRSHQLLA
jgi:hypothetical protein